MNDDCAWMGMRWIQASDVLAFAVLVKNLISVVYLILKWKIHYLTSDILFAFFLLLLLLLLFSNLKLKSQIIRLFVPLHSDLKWLWTDGSSGLLWWMVVTKIVSKIPRWNVNNKRWKNAPFKKEFFVDWFQIHQPNDQNMILDWSWGEFQCSCGSVDGMKSSELECVPFIKSKDFFVWNCFIKAKVEESHCGRYIVYWTIEEVFIGGWCEKDGGGLSIVF